MLPIKDPAETVPVSFDFSDEAASVSASSVAIAVTAGTDAAVASMPQGAATIDGAVVTQLVKLGVDGCSYSLRCLASGPSGEVLLRAAILPVRALPQ